VVSCVSAAEVTPIQKVLQMMQEMVVKAEAEKKEEAVKFSAFSQWCDDQTRTKTNEINKSNDKIEMLKAEIAKAEAHIRALTGHINELDGDIGRWQQDQKSATDVRDKEAADFRATVQDYGESIDALGRAIAILKKQAYDRPQAEESLLQVRSLRLVPQSAKSALTMFLQQPDGSDAMPDSQLFIKAPEANAYEFQSGGVVDMLEKLNDEFGTKKRELEEEELKAQHGFEQIMQWLADSIENANHEIDKKKVERAETEQAKAQAEGDLAQTTADRDADQEYLDDMNALCAQKKADFASRQTLRAEEIEALAKAIEIIGGQSVAGSGEKHLPQFLQTRHKASLAMLRNNGQSPLQERIAAFLAERAQGSGSQLLSLVSQRVQSEPFKKVKKMIKDLIVKLMEEATSETEHKGWCDTELTTNKQTRDARTEDVNKLNAEIERLTSEIAQLTQDIEDLSQALKELEEAMAKATADRVASKAKNEETIQEAKDAQTAVEQAMAVLKEYYAKSAVATALTQQSPGEDAPETFDAPYKGMLPEGGSVIDFLEVILSDFARLESESSSAEATEKEEYDKYIFESRKDKVLKENERQHKTEKRTSDESALNSSQEELKTTQEQLDTANAYYDKLKPTCVDSGITYEERVRRREEEIQSLQEALKILAGTDVDLP